MVDHDRLGLDDVIHEGPAGCAPCHDELQGDQQRGSDAFCQRDIGREQDGREVEPKATVMTRSKAFIFERALPLMHAEKRGRRRRAPTATTLKMPCQPSKNIGSGDFHCVSLTSRR